MPNGLSKAILTSMAITACLVILAAMALSGCKKDPQPSPPQAGGDWRISHSAGVPDYMKKRDDGAYSFEFPKAPGHVNYVTKSYNKDLTGKNITFTFTIEGDATFVPAGQGDEPPTKVVLYVQRQGDTLYAKPNDGTLEHYRWWSTFSVPLKPGTYSIIWPVNPENWINVWGKNGGEHQGAFNDAMRNPQNIGFTLSGKYFAGHGVYIKNGSAKFILKSYSID